MTERMETELRSLKRGTRLTIDVVFPGEYRIGFQCGGKLYVPGSGSYYPFHEALDRCLEVYDKEIGLCDPGEVEK